MPHSHFPPKNLPHVLIVGGGFSGVTAGVQLVRRSPQPLRVTILESSPRIGPGLAYATRDPDHRLNGPTWGHSVDPLRPHDFSAWCERHGVLREDPEALHTDGNAFVRRSVFGDYLTDCVQEHAVWSATGSTLTGVQGQASGLHRAGNGFAVTTTEGRDLNADLVLLATGNAPPRLPASLAPRVAGHPGVIGNPLDGTRLRQVPSHARVLLLGAGLTALDVQSTLLRRNHQGPITVVSRRGLRPRPYPQPSETLARAVQAPPLERILGPRPDFLDPARVPPTVRSWLHALRQQIQADHAQGQRWHQAFDQLRDTVWQLWPLLPTREQQRFLRTLRTWYDVHRFRAPPPNDAWAEAARSLGKIVHRAARVQAIHTPSASGPLSVQLRGLGGQVSFEDFDVLINCTGLDAAAHASSNPFLRNLLDEGWLRPDPVGLGFAVDAQCRAIGRDERVHTGLRLIGPPTLGTFGDPGGAMFIAAQVHRLVPDLLASLGIPADGAQLGALRPETPSFA